jgi:hypothetical protein
MEHIAYFLFYLGCVFVLICVHETGHYLAGRLGGISAGDMRIRLLRWQWRPAALTHPFQPAGL